jgi:hypothetical protein
VLDLTKDAPADEKQFAENAYDYATMNDYLNSYCDPVKFAMKLLPIHRQQPQTPLQNMLLGMNFSDIVDRDHLIQRGHDEALRRVATEPNLTQDQKREVADKTGTLLADAWAKDPKGDLHNIGTMFEKAFNDAKRAVAPGGPITGPGTPQQASSQQNPQPQNSQQQPQQNQQQQQKQQKQPSQTDKAANEAQKAKDAANKLRGIFRR